MVDIQCKSAKKAHTSEI